jgi:hypothetical protein
MTSVTSDLPQVNSSHASAQACVARGCVEAGFQAESGALLEAQHCIAASYQGFGFRAVGEAAEVRAIECKVDDYGPYGY